MPESRHASSGSSSRRHKKRSRWGFASSSGLKADDQVSIRPGTETGPILRAISIQASAELEKTIAARSVAIKKQIEEAQRRAQAARFPAPLILDEQGRQVDAQGNVIVTKIEDLATIQANRAQPQPQPAAPAPKVSIPYIQAPVPRSIAFSSVSSTLFGFLIRSALVVRH